MYASWCDSGSIVIGVLENQAYPISVRSGSAAQVTHFNRDWKLAYRIRSLRVYLPGKEARPEIRILDRLPHADASGAVMDMCIVQQYGMLGNSDSKAALSHYVTCKYVSVRRSTGFWHHTCEMPTRHKPPLPFASSLHTVLLLPTDTCPSLPHVRVVSCDPGVA